MRVESRFLVLAVLVGSVLVMPGAEAELNLWISRHFTGLEAYEGGDYQDAKILLESALNETQTDHRRADTLDGLGQVYTALGSFEEAKAHYRRALDLKEQALGKRHRDVAETLNNLADLYWIIEERDKVEALYRRALDINKRDQLNIDVCRALNGLALWHNAAGEYVETEKLLKRAIRIHEKAERRDHPYLATVLTNLGILYTNLERYDEAEPLFERARYIQDVALREGHPDKSVRLHAEAALLHATGHVTQAVERANRAEEIRDQQTAKGDLY